MGEGILKTLRSRQGLVLKPGRSPYRSIQSSITLIRQTQICWILPNRLALGALPKPDYASILAAANVEVVLSFCAEAEGPLPQAIAEKFHCQRYILPNQSYLVPLQVQHFEVATELLHQHLRRQRPVYVHCRRGIERSPLVCAAYLCRYHQLEVWEALRYVQQVQAIAAPTSAQIKILQAFVSQSSRFPDPTQISV
ncbi:dual specificity protein phosphatase family protein [Thermoleptolyngbya oregonensis NK1-22]|uniref:Dual specificity protein phosphatase family protein n=1 Tax=Thermoleptolyngbya oregonensis NK1-22 TaxID=2547457 RepID=A0AA96Y870_9CYAN|nr:dual specificity protein phosphatase [Thermoleptolyngbya oregonensis]WOB44569.1 dual specificity protein phosphatase family protein [Thermoleptolyngbya oregonensis NK1-22]